MAAPVTSAAIASSTIGAIPVDGTATPVSGIAAGEADGPPGAAAALAAP